MSRVRTTSYAPGAGTAIVGPDVLVLLDANADHPIVDGLREVVTGPVSFPQLAGRLSSLGIEHLPALACAVFEGTDLRLLLRGDAEAVTEGIGDDLTSTHHGRDVTTWREERLSAPRQVILRLGTASNDPLLPLTAGIVSACSLTTESHSMPTESQAPSSTSVASAPATGSEQSAKGRALPSTEREDEAPPNSGASTRTSQSGETSVPPPPREATAGGEFDFGHLLGETQHRSVEDAAVRADAPAPSPAASADADSTEGSSPEVPDANATATVAPEAPSTPEPSATPSATSIDETRIFDDVPEAPAATADAPLGAVGSVGAVPMPPAGGLISSVPGMNSSAISAPLATPETVTQTPSVGDHPPVNDPRAEESGTAGDPTTQSPAPEPTPPPAAATPARPNSGATLDDLPPPPTSEPPVAGTADDDLDSVTVQRLPAGAAAPGTPEVPGQQVQAVHCPRHHPNPPHAERCRRCDTPIENRTISTISRPQLGRLVFPSGGTIPLTKPIVMGRRPPANSTVEDEPAMAVAVKEPEKMLSRVHLEVRLVDWQVQVVDRDSMNHTFIEVPGQPPQQLRPAEAYPIQPGTTVNMADAARFTYVTTDP